MTIYKEILDWSINKPLYLRDAIRRLMISREITDKDINELKSILKKENGFDVISVNACPPTENDIPSISNLDNQIKLKLIKSPHNIAALYNNKPLEFSSEGLSIVYGKNGAGKSSYVKVLKKLCWSRDKDVVLKKNVYAGDKSAQSVNVVFSDRNSDIEFTWKENAPIDKRFNSIFIFDTKCADIYLNNENPSEYKPVGIDVLERLILLSNKVKESIESDIAKIQTYKPQLPKEFEQTSESIWYKSLENLKRNDLIDRLVLSNEQKKELANLEKSLKNLNIVETNKNLTHKKERFQKLFKSLCTIELLLKEDALNTITALKQQVEIKNQACKLAKASYETNCELPIGGEVWKNLWKVAREYAISELNSNYPIIRTDRGNFCPLCQQPLSEDAKTRLNKFELFVKDRTTIELEKSRKELEEKRNEYSLIPQEIIENSLKTELIEDNPGNENIINNYTKQILSAKNDVLEYIDGKVDILPIPFIALFSEKISTEIQDIAKAIDSNNSVLLNRQEKEKEYLELKTFSYLVDYKEQILKYYDEYKIKERLQKCSDVISTTAISRKIGEILESNAINKQKVLFLEYMKRLNPIIAEKMTLHKTRTSSGVTYQKCDFNTINERITDILSEGEQKIVALANFLSESSIENANNTIIFDDPINSLDVDYRESVANIIMELASTRQVIVMTHDLYFLRLLKDAHEKVFSKECYITCLNTIDEKSGIVSDEIPYLAKNVQERINTITEGLNKIKGLDISLIYEKNSITNDLKDKMRQLLERTVEDILVNKTITRFSKNINFKKGNLANIVVVSKADVDFLLSLYARYSEVIHDGSIETEPNTIKESDIKTDLLQYSHWKKDFQDRVKEWTKSN